MISLQPKDIRNKFNLSDPAFLIATWFGSGLIKPAPGTWGTVAALPFGLMLLTFSPLDLIIGILVLFPAGLWASARFTAVVGEEDSSMIVVDEVIGMWIALLPMIMGYPPVFVLFAFLFFRFFDILKPWPISWLDKNIKGALGVILDDVLAGIFAAICLIGIGYVGLG